MNKDTAFEIAKRFLEMENENRAMRGVLNRYWSHQEPWKAFVQKGVQQLQERQIEEQALESLQSTFDRANSDDALMQTLYGNTVGRIDVPRN